MPRKKSISISTEVLTSEQLSKRAVGVEDVDLGGVIKRHRVISQTVFDMMFVHEIIGQAAHEAVHKFMDDFGQSGGVPRSANMEAEGHSPGYSVSSAMGERRMIFSKAYRAVCDESSDKDISFFLSLLSSAYEYSSNPKDLRSMAGRCRSPLRALSRHYGIDSHHDPRDIIRRQVGIPPRHKQKKGGAR